MKTDDKVLIWVSTNTELGEADHFKIANQSKQNLYEFLSKQPYDNVKDILPLIENKDTLTQLEISQIVSLLAMFPIYQAVALFNELIENIIPIVLEISSSDT